MEGVDLLTIKGLKTGPTFSFNDEAAFPDIIRAVTDELTRANGFFRDSPVVLNFAGRLLSKEEWRALKEVLQREGLLLRYAVATQPVSRELLYKEGLPVRETLLASTDEAKAAPPTTTIKGSNALYLRHGLRSGQKEVFEGNVVLMGDVNQGGEILAGGDAVVVGTLRGMVHAGYPDNPDAVVIALNLIPLQLRIGPFIARSDEGPNTQRARQPEIARVRDERIIIEPYPVRL